MTIPRFSQKTLKEQLIERSMKLGFGALHITSLDTLPDFAPRLNQWLELKYHGSMNYMQEHSQVRASPHVLWPEAKSALLFAFPYKPDNQPPSNISPEYHGKIASYAQRRDYHDIVKGKLKELGAFLVRQTNADIKVFVDTGPLMEKPLAEHAGLGWQGKHTVLVSRQLGNWFSLGAILTTLKLPADKPETNHCGTCHKCLKACPTQAFPAPFQLDARRCIAYYTVEHKGLAPRSLRPLFGNRIFGCDDCLAACPWNKFARDCQEIRFSVRPELINPPLTDLLQLDDASFRALFAATPVKRIGRDRFLRNVLVACGNTHNSDLLKLLVPLLNDHSSLVRAMAVWAIHEICPEEIKKRMPNHFPQEQNTLVQEEWLATRKTIKRSIVSEYQISSS